MIGDVLYESGGVVVKKFGMVCQENHSCNCLSSYNIGISITLEQQLDVS